MSKLFISDLHLSPERTDLIQLVSQFLSDQQANFSELYILGDIFNTWLGDDLVPAEFIPFTHQLKKLTTSGKKVFLMIGNRDFMVGEHFAASVGARLINEPYLTEVAGRSCLLLHGDSLCIDDISYQRYRKCVRNPILQWCFLKLPLSIRQNISDKIKQKSRQKKQHKTAMIMDANQTEIIRVMELYNVDLLIHGHTHRPNIHSVNLTGSLQGSRVVLGDWGNQVSYIIADDHGLVLHDHRLAGKKMKL